MKNAIKIFLTIFFLLFVLNFSCANTITSFRINNGSLYTNDSNLSLEILVNVEEEEVDKMQFSCNGENWSPLENYSETKSFDIDIGSYGCNANEGLKTIYVKVVFVNSATHDTQNTITLDLTEPSATGFSPNDSIIGDGANGQLVSVNLSDNNNLETISFSLKRGTTTIYDSNNDACSITGKTTTCSFTDYQINMGGGIYYYTYIVTDSAGNSKTYENNFSFTDSTAPTKANMPSATISETTINLLWTENNENDLNDYAIYRSEQTGFDCNNETLITRTYSNEYSDTSLDENTVYYYKISAIDLTGNESFCSDQNYFNSEYDSNVIPEITRTDVSCDSNYWCYDNSPTFSFFVENAEYSWILTTSTTTNPSDCTFGVDCNTISTTSFDDISNGTSYFKVKAIKPNGSSTVSIFTLKTDNISPPQPKPTISLIGKNVLLEWPKTTDTGGSGLYQYNIYRSKNAKFSSSPSTLIGYVESTDNNYTDSLVSLGETYYYKVLALDTAGNYSIDYNAPIIDINIPTDLNDITATIIIKNSLGEETKYFCKADDFNLTIIFSSKVNNFGLYKKIDDENIETIIENEDDVTEYTFFFTTSAYYNKIDFNIIASHVINDLNEQITMRFDNTNPTISFKNLEENEIIKNSKKIEINANDNFEIIRVELFSDETKLGNATRDGNIWVYTIDANETKEINLKAIANDGANLKSEASIKIRLEKKEIKEELTIEQVVEKINSVFLKKDEINNLLNDITPNSEINQLIEEADQLLKEAETLIEQNLEQSLAKTVQAMEKYDLIIEKINNLEENNNFFNIIFLVMGVIAVISIIIIIAIIIMRTKKFKKIKLMFNKHNMQIDNDIENKK